MMDERQRVIRDLLLRLHEAGISPDEPFYVDFIPGQAPRFHQDESAAPFSSGVTGGGHAAALIPAKR
jgi:hypothetical protein